MNKKEQLIVKYAEDLKSKCNVTPDMELLASSLQIDGPQAVVTFSSTVAASDPSEIETIRKNFLIKKLGLSDSPKLDEGINKVLDLYGKSIRNKYRAVVYYLLTKHFGKESVY